jgi:hypothetical protein
VGHLNKPRAKARHHHDFHDLQLPIGVTNDQATRIEKIV